MRGMILGLLILAATLGVGCSKKPAPAPETPDAAKAAEEAVARQQALAVALWKEIDSLRQGGESNAVLTRLEAAFADDERASIRPMVFALLLNEVANAGDIERAKAMYLEALARDVEQARGAYGIVDGALSGDSDAWLAWCDAMLNAGLPEDLAARTWMQLVQLLKDRKSLSEFAQRVPLAMGMTDRAVAERVFWMALDQAVQDADEAAVEAVTAAIEAARQTPDEFWRIILLARIDLLLKQGATGDAETLIWEKALTLADQDLVRRMQRLQWAMADAGDEEAGERLARRAIAELATRPLTRDDVVATWVRQAAQAGRTDTFLLRTAVALDARIGIARLLDSFEDGFYRTMPEGTPIQRRDCISLAKKMREHAAAEEELSARLAMMLLDGAFYMKDFRAALEIVKAGVPGQDQAWHDMLSNKLGAHAALAENRPLDAIGFFERHMETVRAWEHPQRNPENGFLMHKEAVLGFNAKRIGDIYRDADRPEDAAASYARAREFYRQALALVEAESDEYAAYQEDLNQVPTGE